MYTEANWLFYYTSQHMPAVHILMPRTQEWFRITINRFHKRLATTSLRATHYKAVGRLVPITTVIIEVPGVARQHL